MQMRILVVNPNSNAAVTAALDQSLDRHPLRRAIEVDCVTFPDGPFGIETTRQSAELVGPLCKFVEQRAQDYDAFIVACFSDPGVPAIREMTKKPVLGLCEASITSALNFGERFGVITNMTDDIDGELRLLRAMALETRLAAIEAIGVTVTDLFEVPLTKEKLVEAAQRLKIKGASTIVLGCAGMVPFAQEVAERTGVRIINPVIAAVSLAVAGLCS